MHNSVLQPKDPYDSCADSRGAEIQDADPDWRDQASVPAVASNEPRKVLDHSLRAMMIAPKRRAENQGAKDNSFLCGAIRHHMGEE